MGRERLRSPKTLTRKTLLLRAAGECVWYKRATNSRGHKYLINLNASSSSAFINNLNLLIGINYIKNVQQNNLSLYILPSPGPLPTPSATVHSIASIHYVWPGHSVLLLGMPLPCCHYIERSFVMAGGKEWSLFLNLSRVNLCFFLLLKRKFIDF